MAKYNSLTPDIADTLQAIVGKQRFFAGSAVKPDYAHDEMPIYGRYLPAAVCLAETTEEISEIMKICNDRKIPVTVRGSGNRACRRLCSGTRRNCSFHRENEPDFRV